MGLKRRGCKEALSAKKLGKWNQMHENQLWQKNQMAETDQLKIENRMLRLVGVLRLFSLSLKRSMTIVAGQRHCISGIWHVLFNLPVLISSTMPPVAGQQH